VKDAIQAQDGVMKDREIDALVTGFEEFQIVLLVGWWIESYTDLYANRDQVSRAVVKSLEGARVAFPYQKYRSESDAASGEAEANGN
jgi:small-conductance mechanosensitive channel